METTTQVISEDIKTASHISCLTNQQTYASPPPFPTNLPPSFLFTPSPPHCLPTSLPPHLTTSPPHSLPHIVKDLVSLARLDHVELVGVLNGMVAELCLDC